MVPGKLVYSVDPQYPSAARRAKIEGTVVLGLTISTGGKVKDVQVLSGTPMLADAAAHAARQWRYSMFKLQDQPVEGQAQVAFNFNYG